MNRSSCCTPRALLLVADLSFREKKGIDMGRIRTKDIKDTAKAAYEAYPERFGDNFEINKQKLKELGVLNEKSKRHRNRIAGYIVRVAIKEQRRGK